MVNRQSVLRQFTTMMRRSRVHNESHLRDITRPSSRHFGFLDSALMKVVVHRWNAIAQWQWDVGQNPEEHQDEDSEEDLCGICRVSYEGCCPTCKVPGDDCPLSECTVLSSI